MAECKKGGFDEALNSPIAWILISRAKRELSKLFVKHDFCKDGNLKSSSDLITLGQLIKTVTPDIFEKTAKKFGLSFRVSFNEVIGEYGVYIGHEGYYKDRFWYTQKEIKEAK